MRLFLPLKGCLKAPLGSRPLSDQEGCNVWKRRLDDIVIDLIIVNCRMEGVRRIRKTYRVHCARPPGSCAKCNELKARGLVIELIEPDANEQQATRMVEQFRDADGNTFWSEFRVKKVFATEKEALEFAKSNGITDVDLSSDASESDGD